MIFKAAARVGILTAEVCLVALRVLLPAAGLAVLPLFDVAADRELGEDEAAEVSVEVADELGSPRKDSAVSELCSVEESTDCCVVF